MPLMAFLRVIHVIYICTDGMNPFSREKVEYSMWPIVVTVQNLPRNIRYLPVSIVPGKLEPKNMDPYLDVFVEEVTRFKFL